MRSRIKNRKSKNKRYLKSKNKRYLKSKNKRYLKSKKKPQMGGMDSPKKIEQLTTNKIIEERKLNDKKIIKKLEEIKSIINNNISPDSRMLPLIGSKKIDYIYDFTIGGSMIIDKNFLFQLYDRCILQQIKTHNNSVIKQLKDDIIPPITVNFVKYSTSQFTDTFGIKNFLSAGFDPSLKTHYMEHFSNYKEIYDKFKLQIVNYTTLDLRGGGGYILRKG